MTEQEYRLVPPQSLPRPAVKSGSRRNWLGRIVGVLLLLAVIGAIGFLIQPRKAQDPRGRFAGNGPQTVTAAPATKGDMAITLNALGTVTPLANVTIRTQIAGQLVGLGFEEGQKVAKGDFLAQIDPRPYQIALEQAEGNLARDQALLANAQTDLARYKKLASQDSIARQTVDTAEATVRQYAGVVQTDQGQIDSAKLNLTYCRIISPVAGRVGLRQVDAGNYVQTNDANGIVVLTTTQPITVLFTLPEDQLPAVLAQIRAGKAVEARAFDRGRTKQLATGKLATIDNQIDTTTGTVKMKAVFANEDESLFPNQFVNITLVVETQHDVTLVPVSAVQRGAPGTFVYVVKDDQTVTVRPITIGAQDPQQAVVSAGLNPGDVVVTDGTDRLKDGAEIKLPNADAKPQGGADGGHRRRGKAEGGGGSPPLPSPP